MKTLIKSLLILLFAFSLTACSLWGKPAVMIDYYALEYPPPSGRDLITIDAVVGMERFSADYVFNNNKMLFREKAYIYNDYAYSRWRANPADMLGDILLRDLRATGVFKAVFSHRDTAETHFLLRGGISEFYESDEEGVRSAILSLHITLLDKKQKELTRQIVFQKNYRHSEPAMEKTVQGFAQAMSQATKKLSEQIVSEIYTAITNQKK